MLCPKCGAQLSDSAVICRACGAMLPEQPAATQVPYPPASQPGETAASAQPNAPRTCARCGAPLEDGVRFCTNCGAPAPEPSACADTAQSVPPQQDTANASYTGAAAPFGPGICPRCGSRLAPGARFCTVCGMPAPEAPQGQADWYAPAPGGTVSSPEIGPKHKPKKLLIGLLCGFAALVVIVAVVVFIVVAAGPVFARRQHVDALARVDHRQVRAQGDHLVHELLHAAAVDHQRARALQGDHVARLQLIIVQAADALVGHVLHRHALHAVRHVEREDVHRVKRGHNRHPAAMLLCRAAG